MLPSSSGVVRPAAAVPVPLGPVEPVSLDDDSVMPPLEHPAAVGSAAQKRTAADAEDGLTTTLLHVARRVRANSMPGAPSLSSSPADSLSAAAAAVASKSSARPPPILTHGSDTDDRDSLPSSHSHSMRPERLLTQFSQTPFKTLRVNLQRPGSVSIENPFLGTAQQTQRSQAQSTVTVAVRLMGEPTRDKLYFVAKDVCVLIHTRRGNVAKSICLFDNTEKARMKIDCPCDDGSIATHILPVLTIKGVQHLLHSSRSPIAAPMLKWLMSQVDELCGPPSVDIDSPSTASSTPDTPGRTLAITADGRANGDGRRRSIFLSSPSLAQPVTDRSADGQLQPSLAIATDTPVATATRLHDPNTFHHTLQMQQVHAHHQAMLMQQHLHLHPPPPHPAHSHPLHLPLLPPQPLYPYATSYPVYPPMMAHSFGLPHAHTLPQGSFSTPRVPPSVGVAPGPITPYPLHPFAMTPFTQTTMHLGQYYHPTTTTTTTTTMEFYGGYAPPPPPPV